MKRILAILFVGIAILCGIVLIRGIHLSSQQVQVPKAPLPALDIDIMVRRLSMAIQFKTLSHPWPDDENASALLGLRKYFETAFPLIHLNLRREIVNRHSLLFTWEGKDSGSAPMLLMGHLDVVPVESESEQKWTHPPFSGRVAEGYVWGRGAMDDKVGVMATLEAVEHLLAAGYQPRRTVYLAFGHDEETGGEQGAAKIAALLKSRGVELDFVLDEGGNITDGIVPGVQGPLALIGIAEKGYASLELRVETHGGHSAMPPAQTAIGILASALHKLEASPFSSRLSGPTRAFFEYIAPEMRWPTRIAMANLWLFEPLILQKLEDSPLTAALIRTTQAATIFQGGTQANVLPARARAVLNFRILTGETIAGVVDRVARVVEDTRVTIAPVGPQAEPSPVSAVASREFQWIAHAIRASAPNTLVAPFLLVAATDSRHFAAISKNIYRFLPITIGPKDARRYHGVDERLAVKDYERCVRFYLQLLRNADEVF